MKKNNFIADLNIECYGNWLKYYPATRECPEEGGYHEDIELIININNKKYDIYDYLPQDIQSKIIECLRCARDE